MHQSCILAPLMERPGKRRLCSFAVAFLTLAVACHREQPVPSHATPILSPQGNGWLKGQTHVHSDNSADSRTPPAEVARWYAEHGYDFIVFTDHNRVTRQPSVGTMLVIPGVELTQNLQTCDWPAADGGGCNLHMNALFVDVRASFAVQWSPARGPARLDIYQRELDVVQLYGALAQLNHPNFRWATNGATVTELARRGVKLMEIANQSGDCDDDGDAQHPSTSALWDQALTAGQTLWGVATDDAHHYYDAEAVRQRGETAYSGDRGFIMVRARRDPDAIRAALQAGDFYASTGVRLARVTVGADSLEIALADDTPFDCEFVFIGTAGRELARSRGRSARIVITSAPKGYVRAVITAPLGQRAWTQPVRVQ